MNEKIKGAIQKSKIFIKKNSPTILTTIGIAGSISATILAVKATPKADRLIKMEKNNRNLIKISYIDAIKITWKLYLPSVLMEGAAISCIIGANSINKKRNAALAAAYTITEKTLSTYKDKVIETIGEKNEKAIRDKIAQDNVDEDKKEGKDKSVIVIDNGDTLCKDALSGRYFKSSLENIKKAVNELNRQMTYENYVSLSDYYDKIGLDKTNSSDYTGWNLDNGLIELDISTCLSENDQPCIVIGFEKLPVIDYNIYG